MYPQKPEKHSFPGYISPEKAFAFQKKIGRVPEGEAPKRVILCYQGTLMDRIQEIYPGWFATGAFRKLYWLRDFPGIAVGEFGIGAPQIVAKCEFLIAWGVKEFISIGTAGAIAKELTFGDLILCDRAIRDEGTSHHYLNFDKYAYPTDGGALAKKMQSVPHRIGTSWTSDAFFRPTLEEIIHFQNEGVLTVEMEASALFALATSRKVSMSAAFVISDLLTTEEWHPQFYSEKVEKGLDTLLEIALG